MTGQILEDTAKAMVSEIKATPIKGRPAKTIFFGGGTPTFFTEAQILSIFEAVIETHPPVEDCEITSEANPGTADAAKFKSMRVAGFNRLSMGAQSFVDSDLIRLGRVHKSSEIERAVDLAVSSGFENFNLDLMFALPGQSLAAWRKNLDKAISLGPSHLSLYCLTLEPNTAFYKEHLKGLFVQPGEDLQVEMYDLAVQVTAEHGYGFYEISNFAKPGKECQHNLCYWRGEEYAGYGPGAVGAVTLPGMAKRKRSTVLKQPVRYVEALTQGRSTECEVEWLDESDLRLERIMLGIRLAEGVGLHEVNAPGLEKCGVLGWTEVVGGRVRLTNLGRHYCTEVAIELA